MANSTHVCNMDIRHITALKDEMACRVANLTGIMFMAIDIASQWLFYVDSDNHALMQYSLIFNVTTPITEAGPNVTGACVFIYINVLGFFFREHGLMHCSSDIIVHMPTTELEFFMP